MRIQLAVITVTTGAFWAGAAAAQLDLCTNIRLTAGEQIECRARLANALGEADRLRAQQEFEERIRRANDSLIVPPVLPGTLPLGISSMPSARPLLPSSPAAPRTPDFPGAPPAASRAPPPAPGEIAAPGKDPPAGGAIAPELTAPDPVPAPLPPITPFSGNPSGVLPPPKQ